MLDLLRGRWLGHPLHPVLVHFPAAMWPLALILDLISLFAPDPFLPRAAMVCVLAGEIGAGLAVLFGLLELVSSWSKSNARARLLLHAVVNVCAGGIFGVTLSMRMGAGTAASVTTDVLVLEIIGVGLMLLGNWLGGLLVYRYGLGAMSDGTTETKLA